jgi:hypothetical protein
MLFNITLKKNFIPTANVEEVMPIEGRHMLAVTAETPCPEFQLPVGKHRMHVAAGCAWVTYDGKDVIVEAGHGLTLTCKRDGVVISGLGTHPLIFDILR